MLIKYLMMEDWTAYGMFIFKFLSLTQDFKNDPVYHFWCEDPSTNHFINSMNKLSKSVKLFIIVIQKYQLFIKYLSCRVSATQILLLVLKFLKIH